MGEAVVTDKEITGKRPVKSQTENFIRSSYEMVKAGIYTVEQVKKAFAKGNYYLFEGEIEKMVNDAEPKTKLENPKEFVKFLIETGAVRKGAAPSAGEGMVRINSKERAYEVANNPSNEAEVTAIIEILSAMLELRNKLNPLISNKATCSIALKNKVEKEAKESAGEAAPTQP